MRLFRKPLMLIVMAVVTAATVFSMIPPALPAVGAGQAMERAANYLLAQEKAQGQPLSPWSYIALACAGRDLTGTKVLQSCKSQFDSLESGELDDSKLTNYSLLVLTLLASGGNPHDYQGQDLVQKIQSAQLPSGKFSDYADGSGMGHNGEQVLVNAHAWAVLTLYAAGAEIPDAKKARQWLIDQQHAGGSFNWNLADAKPDVDSTGTALMSLGALGEKKDSPTVQKSVAYLKGIQETNGGFSSWGAANAESCHLIIAGLMAVGIDPAGPEWTKSGGNPLTALQGYQLPDSSFEHVKGTGGNIIATEQSLLALAEVNRGKQFVDWLREKSAAVTTATKVTLPERKIRFKLGEKKYDVTSGGQKQTLEADVVPFLENGRTYVPVRNLALSLGVPESGINWSSSTGTVTFADKGVTISLSIGEKTIYINNQPSQMDVPPLLLNERTFLPARYVAGAFGYTVNWDEKEQAVLINK